MSDQATGIHLSTGHEYPDSPCGFTDKLTHKVQDVTCPECKRILIKKAKYVLRVLAAAGEQEQGDG